MHILVSFCNIRVQGLPVLGLLDPIENECRALRLPDDLSSLKGITGLAVSDRCVYAVAQTFGPALGNRRTSPSALLIFDRSDLKLLRRYTFQLAADVHSILLVEDSLFVVSTGTDEVIELGISDTECISEKIFWRREPDDLREDIHHLNAICQSSRGLLISGFGKKIDDLWDSAREGFIFNISRGEVVASGIDQPHSLIEVNGELAFCESRRRMVRTLKGPCIETLPGYTRGICVIFRELFVATSVGRQISRSHGTTINNPSAPGNLEGRCSISRFSVDGWKLEGIIDMTAHASEIFDLLAIDGTDGWPVASDLNLRDSAISKPVSVLDAGATLTSVERKKETM